MAEAARSSTPRFANRHRGKEIVGTYTWGRGDFGQIGQGSEADISTPIQIEVLREKCIVHVASNVFHSCVVTADGELFMFGLNDNGQLGCKNRATQLVPVRLDAFESYKVVHAACGQMHTVVVTHQGTLASWGAAEFGQLGHGEAVGVELPHPRIIKGTAELRFAQVACGAQHTLALTTSGHVFAFGQGTFGALGLGDEENRFVPTQLESLWATGIVQVACGENHSGALALCGKVYTWGRGKYGQLGQGTTSSSSVPCLVPGLGGRVQHFSCGGDHCGAVNSAGELYVWGRGTWGQTGFGVTGNEMSPKRVTGPLAGRKVVMAALGSKHTLVLCSDGSVYAWGNDEQGQTGYADRKTRLSPTLVTNMPLKPILFLQAGGDHSMALILERADHEGMSPQMIGQQLQKYGTGVRPLQLPPLLEMAKALQASAASNPPAKVSEVLNAVKGVFSSAGFLVGGFLRTGSRSSRGHGLQVEVVESLYKCLLETYNTEVLSALAAACKQCTEGLQQQVQVDSTAEAQAHWLPAVLVLLQSPLNGEPAHADALLPKLYELVLSLHATSQEQIVACLQSYPAEIFGARFVRAGQRYISQRLAKGLKNAEDSIIATAKVLALFHSANEKANILPYSEFYNTDLSQYLNLKEEYMRWVQPQESEATNVFVSFCQLPFLLTPETKTCILQGEANLVKHHMYRMYNGLYTNSEFLNLRIRREHLLEDALEQILRSSQDLKKPLRVKFVSEGVEEEAVDEGGVTKEFFQLLVREIFDLSFGMFTHNDETRTFWFSQTAMETDPGGAERDLQLVGTVLGLAIYNQVILDVHFPRVVYKKLKSLSPTFEDLKEADPETARGLEQLLAYEGDVENDICRTFEVEYDYFGQRRTHPLVPGGEHVAVTEENRDLFVELYTRYVLHDSIQKQFEAFASGFLQVCGGPALTLFRYEELELLVCGLPHLDFDALEKVTQYDGGYTASHATIRHLWTVVHGFSLEEKKRFLFFTTGCDRAPVGGLGHLQFIVQRSGPDSERLPSSHTCFNILLLPEYGSRGKLRAKLLIAIENSEGFGLQ